MLCICFRCTYAFGAKPKGRIYTTGLNPKELLQDVKLSKRLIRSPVTIPGHYLLYSINIILDILICYFYCKRQLLLFSLLIFFDFQAVDSRHPSDHPG